MMTNGSDREHAAQVFEFRHAMPHRFRNEASRRLSVLGQVRRFGAILFSAYAPGPRRMTSPFL